MSYFMNLLPWKLLLIAACFLAATQGIPMKSGERKPVDIDKPLVMSAAKWACRQLGGKLQDIIRADEQVVAGMMYYIELTMMAHSRQKRLCDVKVWEKAWLGYRKLMPGSGCKDFPGMYPSDAYSSETDYVSSFEEN